MRLALVVALICTSCIPLFAQWQTFEAFNTEITDLTLDSTNVRLASGLTYQDGPMELKLLEGTLVFMKPIGARTIGALFHGRGMMTFRPNSLVERVNMERFTHDQKYETGFDHLIITFTDTRLLALMKALPKSGSVTKDFGKANEEWKAMVRVGTSDEVEHALAAALLNGHGRTVQFMHAKTKEKNLCVYVHDDYSAEPYGLTIWHNDNPMSVSNCADTTAPVLVNNMGISSIDQIAVTSHEVKMNIDRSLMSTVSDKLTFQVVTDSVSWMDVSLFYRLGVDSIVDAQGGRITFFRPESSDNCWIKLPKTYYQGDRGLFTMYYHGNVIVRYQDYTILMSSIGWYPSHGYKQKSTFDLTFSHQESMKLAAVGMNDDISTANQVTTSHWVVDEPIRNCSFHIGFFKEQEIRNEHPAPSATMMYMTTQQKDVVRDHLGQSLRFFTGLFGTIPVSHLTATELPGNHGEAFPGLLHLSSLAFVLSGHHSTDDFFGEQFVAHEVAHQWWGIAVDFASYRDQWLSEGFATYSCLMYAQAASEEQNKHLRLLKQYSKDIVNFGKKTFAADLAPPAIALGYRVNIGANQGGAYNTFVYFKGAWVLHMLRHMMLDFRTMNEDAFMAVMKKFYIDSRGRSVSTADFQKTVEDVVGRDMQWFFDQWVYGNEVPTYRFAWKKTRTPAGKWKVSFKVRQENVSPNFTMIVPIAVSIDGLGTAYYQCVMKGETLAADLPEFDAEPDEVEFNALASVLCDVVKESY